MQYHTWNKIEEEEEELQILKTWLSKYFEIKVCKYLRILEFIFLLGIFKSI